MSDPQQPECPVEYECGCTNFHTSTCPEMEIVCGSSGLGCGRTFKQKDMRFVGHHNACPDCVCTNCDAMMEPCDFQKVICGVCLDNVDTPIMEYLCALRAENNSLKQQLNDYVPPSYELLCHENAHLTEENERLKAEQKRLQNELAFYDAFTISSLKNEAWADTQKLAEVTMENTALKQRLLGAIEILETSRTNVKDQDSWFVVAEKFNDGRLKALSVLNKDLSPSAVVSAFEKTNSSSEHQQRQDTLDKLLESRHLVQNWLLNSRYFKENSAFRLIEDGALRQLDRDFRLAWAELHGAKA